MKWKQIYIKIEILAIEKIKIAVLVVLLKMLQANRYMESREAKSQTTELVFKQS